MADSGRGIRDEFRRRQEFQKVVGLRAKVEDIVGFLFARKSEEERKALVCGLHNAGIIKGSDLYMKTFGKLHDELNISQKVCKVLLDRNLVKQGAPKDVMWYGDLSISSMPKGAARLVPPQLHDIAAAGGSKLDVGRVRGYAKAVSGKRWIQVAQEYMSEEEQTDALCNPAASEIIYGYRAMLRIISAVLPVTQSMVESDSFVGTLYMVDATGSSATSGIDWSTVVWILQAKPPEMHYLEAMGRLVMGLELVFASQPARKFAMGVIGCADILDIYTFWAEDQKLVQGKMVPVPRTVTNTMLTLHRTHSGVEMLMKFMCASPHILSYPNLDDFSNANGSVHGTDGNAAPFKANVWNGLERPE